MVSVPAPKRLRSSKGSARPDDRRYDEAAAAHARRLLRHFVDEKGTQQNAAEALGINQGTISRSMKDENQPSLRVLIALRPHLRMTIDEMLGLAPIRTEGAPDGVQAILSEILSRLK